LEEKQKRDAEEAAPGKDSPEHLFLGDFYSEESRDIVFQIQLPSIKKEDQEFKIANVTLRYYNILTESYDMVESSCYIKRSPDTPVDQKRDYALDLQINRLIAAGAMEEAQKIKDLPKARAVVNDAIVRIKGSISVEDKFTKGLIDDLNEILGDMKDTSTFQRVAVAKMAWKGDAHSKQRQVGDAGGSYQTSAKTNMQSKAKNFSMEKKKLNLSTPKNQTK